MSGYRIFHGIWPRFVVVLIIAAITFGLSQDVFASPLTAPKISLVPAKGIAGSSATVSGTGWTPAPNAQPYQIRWNSKSGQLLGEFSPNQNGAFSKAITIPIGANPGAHQVWVCQGCGIPNIEKWVQGTFTIVLPAAPPPTAEPTICDPTGAPGELVVNFEDIPVGDRILDVLLPQGVTFSLEYPTVETYLNASSGTHVLVNKFAPANEFGSAGVPLVMEFQYIQDAIGMFIGTNVAEEAEILATLTAYGEDEEGNPIVVGTAMETLSAEVNPLDTCLFVEAPGKIIRATLDYGPGASVGASELIDDLVLRGPETPVPVPEDDRPPEVTILAPEEGKLVTEAFEPLRGEIKENRRIDRVEVWVNGEFLKEIAASWLGLERYWFLDVIDQDDLTSCGENTVEVVAYDDNDNPGRDLVVVNCLGPGDLEVTAVDPVQVLYNAPLIKEKSTAFRAIVNSSFICPLDVNFRLELPADQWSAVPSGMLGTPIGLPAGYSYPEIWGPVTIPPGAVDFEVMLPYIPAGSESQAFNPSTGQAGVVESSYGGSLNGADIRVVPRPVADRVSFAVEIDPEGVFTETDETNNRMESADLEVITTRGFKLYLVPWVFELYPTDLETESDYQYYLREAGYTDIATRLQDVKDAEANGSVPISLALSTAEQERLEREARRFVNFFLATWPIADTKISYRLVDEFYFEEEYLKDHGHNTCFNGPFIHDMRNMATTAEPGSDVVILLRAFGCCGQSPGVYVDAGLELAGWPANWEHDMVNVDLDPSHEDYVCWDWDFPLDGAADYVISHELNHWLLGMPGECYACTDPTHVWADCAYCTTDQDGFWVNAWIPIPQGSNYFMYDVNPGAIYWNRLEPSRTKFGTENPDGYLNAIEYFRPVEDPEVLVVKGSLTADGEVSLEPFLILPEAILDLRPAESGQYSVDLLDANGGTLGSWGFSPDFMVYPPAPDLPYEIPVVYFSYRVPWQEGTAVVEVRDPQGRTVAARAVSANAPEVTVTLPAGGEKWVIGRVYSISWEAQDPDEEPLFSTVLISRDGGDSWTTLALDLEGTIFEINTLGYPAGENYLIKVLVSDGIHTAAGLSGKTFAIYSGPQLQPLLPVYLAAGALALVVVVLGAFYLIRRRR